jgi:hypothetical protein
MLTMGPYYSFERPHDQGYNAERVSVVICVPFDEEKAIAGQENEKVSPVRLALEEHLAEGEEVLSFARGDLPGFSARPHYLGLTSDRLIFLPIEKGAPGDKALSIGREHVHSIRWRGGLRPKLRITLPKDILDIGVRGTKRRQLGREMTDAWAGSEEDPVGEPGNEALLEQARELQQLGLPASALYLLEQGRQGGDTYQVSASQARLEEALASDLLAMRAAAGFFFADVALQILLVLLVMIASVLTRQPAAGSNLEAEQIARVLISLWLGVGLWQGRSDRRGWAILWAVAILLLVGVSSFLSGDVAGFLIQLVYSGSIALALAGRSSRKRTLAAIGIFAVGYVGLPAVLLLLSIL